MIDFLLCPFSFKDNHLVLTFRLFVGLVLNISTAALTNLGFPSLAEAPYTGNTTQKINQNERYMGPAGQNTLRAFPQIVVYEISIAIAPTTKRQGMSWSLGRFWL